MNYSKKFTQVSKAAAKAKFRRMASGVGRTGVTNFECGFSTWWIGTDDEDETNLAIYAVTTYHSEATLNRMYKTNCKSY